VDHPEGRVDLVVGQVAQAPHLGQRRLLRVEAQGHHHPGHVTGGDGSGRGGRGRPPPGGRRGGGRGAGSPSRGPCPRGERRGPRLERLTPARAAARAVPSITPQPKSWSKPVPPRSSAVLNSRARSSAALTTHTGDV